MSSTVKIAFHGKMGAGKDTAVDYLIETYGGTRITFAEPIYDILHYAQKVCGFNKEKDRKFLQFIGTEWGREKDNDIWVKLCVEKSKKIEGNIYNNDCRFENELDALRDAGFTCIKINRSNSFKNRVGNGSLSHISEKGLDDDLFDYIVDNNSSIDEFHKKLEQIYLLLINV